jgi:nucleotide-binding universal stress UspA family protein
MRTRSSSSRDTVVCGVDFSVHSRRALRYAVAAAKRLNATLTVLFVEDPLLITSAVFAYDESALAKETASQLRRFVRQVIGQAPGVPTQSVVAMGEPAREIEKAAARLGATLIVVGTQGLRGVRRIFLGSTTRQVLRTTSVPVLAIPPRAPTKPSARWPGRRVVVAVDLDDHTMADARAAAELAHRLGAKVVLVHVLPAIEAPPWIRLRNVRDATRLEEAEAKLTRVAETLAAGIHIKTHVLVGNPAEAIGSFTRRRIDLVILRLRRGKGVFGSRPGSLTYELLTVASTPVLAIPGTPSEAERQVDQVVRAS